MIGVTVTGVDKVTKNLRGARAGTGPATARGVRLGVAIVNRAWKLELSRKGEVDAFWGKGGATDDGLAVRTGRTRASITGEQFRSGDTYVGVVGSKEKHLKDHEDGATLAGTSPGGFHRIPTAAAKTAAGVDRNAGRSIRDILNAFIFRSRKGSLWAAIHTTAGQNPIRSLAARTAFRTAQRAAIGMVASGMTLLYLLVKSITLRPRKIAARVRREQEKPVVEALRSQVSIVVAQANR